MQLSTLLTQTSSAKSKKTRLGRGNGSGKGKTAGRGMKGQNCRSNGGRNAAFGGESRDGSWWRKVPKLRGLGNTRPRKANFEILQSSQILASDLTEVNPVTLFEAGLIKGERPIKILRDVDLPAKIVLEGVATSSSLAPLLKKSKKESQVDQVEKKK